jgi:hypothetical protein
MTLLEMALALAITGILMTAIGSAVLLASKAIPSQQSTANQSALGATVVDGLLGELRAALYISERNAHSIRFTTPDRNGDGRPEVIRYAWSGTAGAPLTRQINNGTVVNLLDQVQSVSFAYRTQTVADTYPGPPVEGAEQVLASHWPAAGSYSSREYKIDKDAWPAQYISPTVPASSARWRPTKVTLRAKDGGGNIENVGVQIRAAGADMLPTSTLYEQVIVSEATLVGSYQDCVVSFSVTPQLDAGQAIAIVLENNTRSGVAGKFEWSEKLGSGLAKTSNGGGSYSVMSGDSLIYELYGRPLVPGTKTVNRTYITGVEICLQATSDPTSCITTGCVLLNRPEALAAYWESPMSENPTTADRNADGQGDFTAAGGFSTPTLNTAGFWQADRALTTAPSHPMTQFTTIEVRWEDAATSGGGVAVGAIVDSRALLAGVIEAVLQRKSDGSGQQLLLYTRSVLILPVLLGTIDNLPNGMLDTALYINPASNSFIVAVNGNYAGSFSYSRVNLTSPGGVSLYPVGSETGGRIDHLRIRVGGAPQ